MENSPHTSLHLVQLGQHIKDPTERSATKEAHQLRGNATEQALMETALKWEANVDPDFESKWHHKCEVLEVYVCLGGVHVLYVYALAV